MNILVIDDHPLMRDAVVQEVQRMGPGTRVRAAGDCDAGLALAAEQGEPDLVLLDLHLPGLSGMAALRRWRERHPSVAVVVLSAEEQAPLVTAAFDAGATGYIPKSTPGEVMRSAIRLVLDGGRYLPPVLLQPAVRQEASVAAATATPRRLPHEPATNPAAALRALGLTPRQGEVLRLLASGAPNKVICRELGLAERTVKAHVTAILRATGSASRTQAAVRAAELGLSPGRAAGPAAGTSTAATRTRSEA